MNIQQCFRIFNLGVNASIDEAKRAYRKLAQIWHPDRHSDKPYLLKKRAEREMQKINVAYERVVAFLSSRELKNRQAKAEARAQAPPEKGSTNRKWGGRKVLFAVSFLLICSLLIIGYTFRDQRKPHSKYSNASRPNRNDATVSPEWQKGQGRRAVRVSVKPESPGLNARMDARKKERFTKTTAVSVTPESHKLKARLDAPKKERLKRPAAVSVTPESPKLKARLDVSKKERSKKTAVVPVEPAPPKLEAGLDALKEKRFKKAVALFVGILAGNPSMMAKVSKPYAQALLGFASKTAQADRKKAKALLLRVVELEPANKQVHFRLGLIYAGLKDYPKAIDAYQKAAELDPQFPEAFFNLAYVYAVTKDYSNAKKMYRQVVKLAPPFLDEALFNLAITHEKLGKRDRSIRTLERAIRVNPKNETAKRYLKRLKGRSAEKK